MKKATTIIKNINSELRGKDMRFRIRTKAELLAQEFEDDISDEVGELMGKLTTEFTDGSEIELTGYVFDKIRQALLDEIKKRLK
jgi:hypothetical protein